MHNTFSQPPSSALTPRPIPSDAEIQAEISEHEAGLLALTQHPDGAKARNAYMLLWELEAVKREFKEVKKLDRRSLRRELRKERKRKERRRTRERISACVEAEELERAVGMMAELRV